MWKNPSSGPVNLEIEYLPGSARDKARSQRACPARSVGGNEFQRLGDSGCGGESLLAVSSTLTARPAFSGAKLTLPTTSGG